MKFIEAAVFLSLATGLHAMAFSGGDPFGAVEGGEHGAATVTLAAISPDMAQIIDGWNTAPNVADSPQMTTPLAKDAGFAAPTSDAPFVAALPPAFLAPTQDSAPKAAQTAPERPKTPKAKSKPAQAAKSKPAKQAATSANAPSASRAAQKASGTPAPQTQGSGTDKKVMAAWGSKIRSAIAKSQRYPKGVKAAGVVQVTLSLDASGRLMAVKLRKSSGHAELDRAAMAAITAAKLPRAPKAMRQAQATFNLPIHFKP